MPAACHLFEGPTWKGLDLGPNRGALGILHALQWAPWDLRAPSAKCPMGVCSCPVCHPSVHPRCPGVPFGPSSPLGTGPFLGGGGRSPRLPSWPCAVVWGSPRDSPPVCSLSGGSPSVTEGPLCTQVPPDLGPPSVSLRCTQLNSNATSERKAPVLSCVLGHRVTHLLSMCS